jgi:hypothetical protein
MTVRSRKSAKKLPGEKAELPEKKQVGPLAGQVW